MGQRLISLLLQLALSVRQQSTFRPRCRARQPQFTLTPLSDNKNRCSSFLHSDIISLSAKKPKNGNDSRVLQNANRFHSNCYSGKHRTWCWETPNSSLKSNKPSSAWPTTMLSKASSSRRVSVRSSITRVVTPVTLKAE